MTWARSRCGECASIAFERRGRGGCVIFQSLETSMSNPVCSRAEIEIDNRIEIVLLCTPVALIALREIDHA